MAREIIQMYDKYHSTKKVYPKIIEECLPEDYQGLPDAIEEIPTVVANPELAGTEGDLEGLQVGDTKYKIGGGKQLYEHVLVWDSSGTSYDAGIHSIKIICDKSTQFTVEELKVWLSSNGFNYSGSNADVKYMYGGGSGYVQYGQNEFWPFLGLINYKDDQFIGKVMRHQNTYFIWSTPSSFFTNCEYTIIPL